MSNVPADLKYTESHEWVRIEADGTASVGVTDHAQEALGDIVFLELPEPGSKLTATEPCGVIESVKAASDIYSPVSGEVIEINQAVADAPESVNADAYAAWLFKVRLSGKTADLLDAAAYQSAIAEE
ncbi:MAG: glycine cleavage system protein GcvH [Azoarcus sp.]|jgi:glycine cleavage system H protein|nr:glycine cleavage system protein GcvH [Azoarcus sp.]